MTKVLAQFVLQFPAQLRRFLGAGFMPPLAGFIIEDLRLRMIPTVNDEGQGAQLLIHYSFSLQRASSALRATDTYDQIGSLMMLSKL